MTITTITMITMIDRGRHDRHAPGSGVAGIPATGPRGMWIIEQWLKLL
jgi:hypothetical protein